MKLHCLFTILTLASLIGCVKDPQQQSQPQTKIGSNQSRSTADVVVTRWTDVPGTNGAVRFANIKGHILEGGPYAAYVWFRRGTDNGLHKHSTLLPTDVLSGTFYAVINGRRIQYTAGQSYILPANLVHESGCTADADCELFQYQSDRFDLIPVTN